MKVVILTAVLAAVLSVDAKQSIGTQRSICTGVSDGSFVEDVDSCSNFFVCYNGEPVSQSCGPGSYFDSTDLYCLPDTDNICPQVQCTVDGAFSPHPSDCNLFYVCYQGVLVEQSCGPESYFDQTNLYCLPDTDNICPQPQCSIDGSFSAHPTDCNLFYVCYQGELVEQSCGEGSYFDKTNLYCLPDTNNICPVAQCTVEGAFSPHPTECALFYVCYDGVLVEQTCGNGSYFDKTNFYCLPDTENICWPSNCTCVGGYTEGEFVASPNSCYSYYICSSGELVEQNCGYGNYFDNSTKRCERDTSGACWPTNTTSTSTTAPPCKCPGGYEEGDLVENSDSCQSYFICTQGQLVAGSCGVGNYFDSSSKTCVADTNGICWPTTTTPAPCSCPGGYEEGDLIANIDSCKSYFVCTQGELVAASCGTGNYFDSSSKTCVADTNGICWSTTTTSAPCSCPGGYEEGDLIANIDSCKSYFVCTQGELVAASCGTGNYFDSSSKTCVTDTNGICWPTTTTPAPCSCPGGYEEGDLIANIDSCKSYFVCTQGELVAASCGTGNYFDSSSKTCVADTNGICWPTTTTPAPCSCPGGYEEGDLIANIDSCKSYFVCTQGELVAASCGTGNYFDSSSKTCVADTNGICWPTTTTPAPCSCPGGYEEGDLIANIDSCKSYFVCTQGELVAASCGTGNYFDSSSKTCVADTNGICWPTTTTPAPCSCPGGYEEGDLIANIDSCKSYFVCTQGELVAASCGTGNYFDSISKTCVTDTNGICWPTTTTPAPGSCPGGYEEGDLIANIDSCKSYFICTQGELVAASCGTGNYFDSISKTCVTDTNGICWPTTTTPAPGSCPGGYEEGELIPHSDSCYLFYICYNGQLIEDSCGNGNYFDAESKNCVLDTNGTCWVTSTSSTTPSTTTVSTTQSTSASPSTSTSTTVSTTKSTSTVSTTTSPTPSPSTQSTSSSSTTSKSTASPTPTPTTQSTSTEPCTCPGGYEDGELVPHSDSCYLFYICYQGELVEESCGNGNYFDAESKNCVLDTNGTCWLTSTSSTTPSTTKTTSTPTTKSTSTSPTTASSTTVSTTQSTSASPSTSTSTTLLTTKSTSTVSTTTSPTPSPSTQSTSSSSTTSKSTASPTPTPTTQSTSTKPSTCPGGYEDGELVPHSDSCYLFYICYQGELVEESCGNGNYFDVESKSCVLDTNGTCWLTSTSSTTPSTTKTTSTPTTKSTSTSPTTASSTTVSTTQSTSGSPSTSTSTTLSTTKSTSTVSTTTSPTPSPSTQSTSSSSTTSKSTASPTPTPTTQSTSTKPSTCPGGYEDGELVPHSDSCYLFYICYQGELVEESCGNGNYFDVESKSCVLDTNGTCWVTSTSSTTPSTTKTTSTPTTKSTSTSPTTDSSTTVSTTQSTTASPTTSTSTTVSTTKSTSTVSTTTSPTPSPSTQSTSSSSTTSKSTASPTPTPTTQPTSTEPCTCPGGYEDGELVPHSDSCYLFYICYQGELVEESCGNGNYFDVESKSCVLDTNSTCWVTSTSSTTPSTTKTTSTPTTKSTSTSPTTDSSTTVSTTQSTTASPTTSTSTTVSTTKSTSTVSTTTSPTPSPSTQSTSSSSTTSKSTDSSTPTPTTQSTSTVPCTCPGGYEDGEFIPHSDSCYLFYVCYQGELIEQSCGKGNYFEVESRSCVLDTNGTCWVTSTSSTTPSTTKTTSTPTTKSTSTSPTTASSTTVSTTQSTTASPTTSTSTVSTTTSPTPSPSTQSTSSSSTTSKSTASPTPTPTTQSTSTVPCSCPGGYEDGEFIPFPGSCYLFYMCYQGELIEHSCGNGNYFDVESKSCVLDTNGTCWVTSTSSTTPSTTKTTSTPTTVSTTQSTSTSPMTVSTTESTSTLSTTISSTPSTSTQATNSSSNPTTSTTQSTSSKPCSCTGGYEEGEFIINPNSCYLYYVCYQGELVEVSCGFGNFFDNETKSCVLDTTGVCWSQSTSSPNTTATTPSTTSGPCTCPGGYEDGDFIQHPDSCYLFYICYQGELSELSCGEGNYFDNSTNRCTLDTAGICWTNTSTPAPGTCPNGSLEGELISNPLACYLYYICSSGQLVEGNCGTGNYFNNATKVCEPDTGGCCWPIQPTPQPPAPSPCECPNGLVEGQLTANPSACYLYNICHNGELVEGHCGTGNFFNSTSNICETDNCGCCWPIKPTPPSPTPCECPNGSQEGQFTAHPSSCYLFHICHDGKLIEQNCGVGNYFNNATGICEPDTGGCCWPDKPSPPVKCANGAQEGQFTAHPSSCYLFHICHDGKLIQQNCGTGSYFNSTSSICEPDTCGNCWSKPIICPGDFRNGDFIAYPGECDKFFICNEGVLVQQECGVGYFFDTDNKYCTRDIDGVCWSVQTQNKTCEGAPDGTFLPNEAACDKFFMCYNNTKVLQECGIGNLFNTASLACTRDSLGTCWKKVPNVCANAITGTFVPNPFNCQEFYVCHKDRAILQQCGSGNWFNPTLMVCQPDLNAECVNICMGTRARINLAHPNCNQFYRCFNGLTVGVDTCPPGTYYDATDGICSASTICEADLCSKSTNGIVYPVQNDVTSFYTCYNQMPLKLNCPDGTSFDSDLLVCTPDTGRCIAQKNGHVVPSYNNPNAYYVCKDNMAIFEQCPSYTIFDEKKRICVPAQRKRFVNNICSSEANGTTLSGDACNKFNLCLDGEVIEQNCGAYSSFNQKLNQCVFNLSCYDQNEICIKSSDIERFPDARYETSFIRCKQGLAVIEKCPKDMIYSHDIGYCVPRDLAMTQNELDELCANVPDNTLAPALDCRKFYICQNSVAVLQQCAIDQYYDVKMRTCRPDVERQCWMRSETLRRSFHLKTVCHEGELRIGKTRKDCTEFEICTFGIWTRSTCSAGHYFDSARMACIPGDSKIVCPTAVECIGAMLRESEKLCTNYYRCENNRWTIQKCPIGEFFSSIYYTCTKDASACAREPEMRSTQPNHCSLNETRASDVNCGLYHVCYEGEWWYRYCETGAYFNKSLEACVPNDGTCNLISKAGPCKNGTAKKSEFDPCITYHLCVDGNWTVQHCPTGHHFNESHKACMLDYEDRACKAELKNVSSMCTEGSRRYKVSNCTAFEICSLGKWLSVPCRAGYYFDTVLEICITNCGECSADGVLRRECVDSTSRPNQNNCSEFYHCSRNVWHLENCLEGFQYNATIDKCIPANSTCAVSDHLNWMTNKCVGSKSGSYVAHEYDCTKYYLCIDDQAVEGACSYGKFYDTASNLCQLNDGACTLRTQTNDKVCESKPNGSQVQNPANCSTFYICSDAQPLLSYCSPGLYFNPDLGACQTDTGVCNKPRFCDNNPGGHIPHETYCNIFYACVRGVAIPVACEEEQLFDPISRKCIADEEKRCIDGLLVGDEICSKVESGVSLVDPEDCTKYIICLRGLAQKLQCPQGQFFDSAMMFCMPDDGSCPYVDGPDLPNNSSIPPDPISCIGKHGDLMPDPEHCNEFYICIYGNLRHDRCFDGEYFDRNMYSCTKMVADEKCPTAADMSTLCETSEDGMNFADQTDCRKHYQCNDAELQSKKCRTGESFDTLLGFCRQNDGTCLLENGQRVGACAGKHGKLTANNENCRGYFTCVNGQKIADECENGEYFDKLTAECEKDINNTCRPVEDEFTNSTQLSCTNLTELLFYPNFLDGCKTFFQCVKGIPRVHKCPDDLLFDGETGICDWKDYVKCIDMTDHRQNNEICANANNGTRYANTQDNCDSYIVCTDGKPKHYKCDQGLKYNVQVEKCDLSVNVNCAMTV